MGLTICYFQGGKAERQGTSEEYHLDQQEINSYFNKAILIHFYSCYAG